MSAPAEPCVLLIDLENCPHQIGGLLDQLDRYTRVVICYAQSGAKIPLDWLPALSQMLTTGRLQIQRMPSTGKNAADFGISFFAGVLTQQIPDARFTIVSNDTDLDHVVQLLHSLKREAKRSGSHAAASTAELPPATAASTSPTATTRTLGTFCAQMLAHSGNRPGKAESLLNALKAHFQQSESVAHHVFKQLEQLGIVRLDGTKVTFNEDKLTEWAPHREP
jgi:PIN domain